MRTKPALLLIVAVTGWSLAPPAPESRESALGEEIITVIAAALDSPAPALSTIGIRFMVSTLDFGTAFRLTARVVPIETGGSTIGPPRFTGFLHFAYEPPGDTGEELPERDNCRATLTDSRDGLQRAADTGGMFWLDDTDDIYPGAGVVYSTTYGDRDTGRAKVWVNRREQPPGGLPHSVTHATLHATLNDTYFTESTRLQDMIRVESAARSAAAGCYHLVREPGR